MAKKRIYLHSGCTLLNLAVTNHPKKCFCFGLIHNLFGSEASGKSLLSLLACINTFLVSRTHGKKSFIVYDDSERAFNYEFASRSCKDFVDSLEEAETLDEFKKAKSNVILTKSTTFEEFYEKLCILSDKDFDLGIYVLDSYDALTSIDSKDDITESSYGTEKVRKFSTFAGRIATICEKKNILMILNNQLRDNISNIRFGKKYRVSGGFIVKHYSSLRLQLEKSSKKTEKAHGSEVPIILDIDFLVVKSRLGIPFRKGTFKINLYAGAIDDVLTNVEYLIKVGTIKRVNNRYEWEGKKLYLTDLVKYIRANNQKKQLVDLVTEAFLKEEKKLYESNKFDYLDEIKDLLIENENTESE